MIEKNLEISVHNPKKYNLCAPYQIEAQCCDARIDSPQDSQEPPQDPPQDPHQDLCQESSLGPSQSLL